MGKKRLDIEFIRSEFEQIGWILKPVEYINCAQKLEYVCENRHIHSISWDNFKAGHRCPYCDGQGKLDILIIKEFFEEYDYELLDNEYINDAYKLKYRCPEGHEHSMRWGNFRNGRRCPTCAVMSISERMSGNRHYNWKDGITKFNKELRNFVKSIGWVDEIFRRDNYICQKCKKSGGELIAHHLVLLSEIREYFNINTIEEAEKCGLLFDMTNGITLCEECHKWVHSDENVDNEFSHSLTKAMYN